MKGRMQDWGPWRRLAFLRRDCRGATTLEWAMLLAAIALPAYGMIRLGLATLVAHYQMAATLNGLPFP